MGGSVFGSEFDGLAQPLQKSEGEMPLRSKSKMADLEFNVEQLEFKLKVERSEKKVINQDYERMTEEHKAYI